MSLDSLTEVLSGVACEAAVRNEALLVLRANSYLAPLLVISHFDVIDILVTSFCASERPQWGIVDNLLLCLSNALLMTHDSLDSALAARLINLSRIVTEAFVKTAGSDISYRPDLFSYASALIYCFDEEFFLLDLDSLLAIADHSLVGFLPRASLVPILMERFQSAETVVDKAKDTSIYERLSKPFSSNDDDAVLFFLTLWVARRKTVLKSPAAITALSNHFKILMELSDKPGPNQASAELVFRFISATDKDRQELLDRGQNVMDYVFGMMRQRRPSNLRALQDLKAEPKRPQNTAVTHKTEIDILDNKGKKGKKKRWMPRYLLLLEQAKLVCWSTDEIVMKKGMALTFSDISIIQLSDQGRKESDKENVMKLVTKKGEYFLAFKTYPEALQWANMLRQMTKI